MLQTLKWSEDGELSQLDMERILKSLQEQKTTADCVVEHREPILSVNK